MGVETRRGLTDMPSLVQKRILLGLIGLTALLSACGSTHKAEQHAPLSRSQLIARADAICGGLNRQFLAHAPKSASVSEIARISPGRAALERTVVSELRKLAPPAAMTSIWQQIIGYRLILADELRELGQDAKTNDSAALKTLTTSKKRLHRQLLVAATKAGFKECGRTG